MPTTRRSGELRLAALGVAALAILVIWLVTRQSGAPPRTLQLAMLNDSGVTGTVTFAEAGAGRTRVDVQVEPAGNLDMPAHIHPGSCDDLTPQPKFPLENVRDGASTTDVPATIAELFAGGLALNVHRSNDDLGTYTACVDIR
ncbi:MAG: hypothetical protein FIA92_10240 [Chloroflexi bacterium]|nr:hypothetical protein [Chloroflexota bacterium]